ncbi:nitric oxide synthase oxygenase, partial [Actinoplanes philippinensis]|uniref:nitric oxide synthase oxygenase n=1 Tax=Actinoplanes philippinensis TaxID=35752 RepID=UPI0033FB8FA7
MTAGHFTDPSPASYRPEAGGDIDQLAESFLRRCADGLGWAADELTRRLAGVRAEIAGTGTYRHTREELTYGAKLAWRQHVRCIGMLYWRSLTVIDAREAHTADDIAGRLDHHLRWAFNGGRIRPLVTVFRPDTPDAAGPRIMNRQLVQYAGHSRPDGTIHGDPLNASFTSEVRKLGWAGGAGRFDRLPVLLDTGDHPQAIRELDPAACPDVPIEHPSLPWMTDLGLRWYAFPTVSDMELRIGGVVYPAAPFSGWYVCTEIGTRNFGTDGDASRLVERLVQRDRTATTLGGYLG